MHWVPKGATYEETLEALEDRFGEEHLSAAYGSQLKTKAQDVGEFLQEFATAVEQLAYSAYRALPEDHVRRDTGKTFAFGGLELWGAGPRELLNLRSVAAVPRSPPKAQSGEVLTLSEGSTVP
jgi:hypothetical protein